MQRANAAHVTFEMDGLAEGWQITLHPRLTMRKRHESGVLKRMSKGNWVVFLVKRVKWSW